MAVRLDQLGLESSGGFSKIPGTWAGRTQRVGAAGTINCRPYAWSYHVAWVLRGAPSKEHSPKRTRRTFSGPAVEVMWHHFCLILFTIHESRRRSRSREGNEMPPLDEGVTKTRAEERVELRYGCYSFQINNLSHIRSVVG